MEWAQREWEREIEEKTRRGDQKEKEGRREKKKKEKRRKGEFI